MHRVKKSFLMVGFITFFVSSMSFASREVGNGGDGLKIDAETYYLLDFLEAGVELNPHVDRNIDPDPEMLDLITAWGLDEASTKTIGQKLEEIGRISKLVRIMLLQVGARLSFRFVNLPLLDINDDDGSLDYDEELLVQLAVRVKDVVMIDRNLWGFLSQEHKAGLIIHEIIYAMAPYIDINGITRQDSQQARHLTGYLFSGELQRKGFKGFVNMFKKIGVSVLEPASEEFTTERADGEIVYQLSLWLRIRGYDRDDHHNGEVADLNLYFGSIGKMKNYVVTDFFRDTVPRHSGYVGAFPVLKTLKLGLDKSRFIFFRHSAGLPDAEVSHDFSRISKSSLLRLCRTVYAKSVSKIVGLIK